MNIGDRVIALVDPRTNDESPEAPGTVTRVHADGSCDVTAQLVDGTSKALSRVAIVADEAAAQEALATYLPDMPEIQDGHGERRKATTTDVLRWVSVAYPPAGAPAEPVVEEPPAPVVEE